MALQEAESACLTYFYCDFRDEDKQSCHNLILSILSQLAAHSSSYCDVLSRLYSTHDYGRRKPSNGDLTQCPKKTLSVPTQGPIYLIIDALDECPNHAGMPTSREEVLDLIQDLVDLQLPNAHISVTSRPEIDIQTALEPFTSPHISLHDKPRTSLTISILSFIQTRRYRDGVRRTGVL